MFIFFNPLVKQGLLDVRMNSFYSAEDIFLENFHLVRELFLIGIVYHLNNQPTVNGFKNIIDSIFRKLEGAAHKPESGVSPSSQDTISVHHWWDPVSQKG